MSRIIIFLSLFLASNVLCQEDLFDEIEKSNEKTKETKFTITFDLFTDLWSNVPDSVELGKVNMGINIYAQFTIPIKSSNFGLNLGLGLGVHNLYSDSKLSLDSNGVSNFIPIPEIFNGKDIDFKKNKITLNYIDVPIAFVYKSEKDFQASVGGKAGLLIHSYSKYRGDDYMSSKEDEEIKLKIYKIKNLQKFRYGVTGHIGYKFINFNVFYSLNSLFEKDKGVPDFQSISIGISLLR